MPESWRVPDVPSYRTIRFPYSRHSSFAELCGLVDAFKPRDVYPCTVDENKWDPELSMRHLFGPFCSCDTFRHDTEMMKQYEARLEQETYERRVQSETQYETQSSGAGTTSPHANHHAIPRMDGEGARSGEHNVDSENYFAAPTDVLVLCEEAAPALGIQLTPPAQKQHHGPSPTDEIGDGQDTTVADDSELPAVLNAIPSAVTKRKATEAHSASNEYKRRRIKNWRIAYEAASGLNGLTWADYGDLVSARPLTEEEEL